MTARVHLFRRVLPASRHEGNSSMRIWVVQPAIPSKSAGPISVPTRLGVGVTARALPATIFFKSDPSSVNRALGLTLRTGVGVNPRSMLPALRSFCIAVWCAKAVSHPPFPFLFDDRPVVGEVAADALVGLVEKSSRRQIVPTERARTLIAYLQSLNNAYEYPEARHVAPAAAKEGAHK